MPPPAAALTYRSAKPPAGDNDMLIDLVQSNELPAIFLYLWGDRWSGQFVLQRICFNDADASAFAVAAFASLNSKC